MSGVATVLRLLAACLAVAGCVAPGTVITPERRAAIDKANEQPPPWYYGGP